MPSLDKKEAILQTTMELVAEHGFHDAPCLLIAERAGVAAGTIYRYFKNKDDLIVELYRTLEARINAEVQEGYSDKMPLRERFIHLASGLLRYFILYPLEFRYVEQFHNSPYGVAFRRDRMLGQDGVNERGIYYELFREGVAQQVIKDLPLVLLFDLAFGPVLAITRNHVLGFLHLDEDLIGKAAEACWDSLKR
jgi:AcrR family transcriptional regulator